MATCNCGWEDLRDLPSTCSVGRTLRAAVKRSRHNVCKIGGATAENHEAYGTALRAFNLHAGYVTLADDGVTLIPQSDRLGSQQ